MGLQDIFITQNEANQLFMTILIGWATINIVAPAVAIFLVHKKSEMYYFLLMNVLFNFVNLGIAIPTQVMLEKRRETAPVTRELLENSISLENILIFNAGLDLLYITIGLIMFLSPNKVRHSLLKGFGLSVIIQATFLFILDLTAYISNQLHTNAIIEYIFTRLGS